MKMVLYSQVVRTYRDLLWTCVWAEITATEFSGLCWHNYIIFLSTSW